MKIEIEVPTYDKKTGIQYKWEDEFEIEVQLTDNGVIIIANEAGLKSLANHILNLSQPEIDSGKHIHFDEYNSLEKGSLELIIQKNPQC